MTKALCLFSLRALLVFSLFVVCWPLVGTLYGTAFRETGNYIGTAWSERIVTFSPSQEQQRRRDTELTVINPKARQKRTTALSSRRHAYMPTALVITLALATPVPWARRFRTALLALVFVSLYVAFKLWLLPLAYGPDQVQVAAENTNASASFIGTFFWIVSASSAGWAIVPILIWSLLTFRGREWRRFIADHPLDSRTSSSRKGETHPVSHG